VGVTIGKLTNVSTTSFTHSSGQGDGATAPTLNATECGAGKNDWIAVVWKACDDTCHELMSLGRDTIPDAFGGAPKDWQKIFDNAAAQQDRFRKSWIAHMFPGSAAEGASAGAISFGDFHHDQAMTPMFAILRDDYVDPGSPRRS
jgi:hypothetical protein